MAQADITLERRLHGSSGQARNLYAELMRNLTTRAKPEGGALASVVERWVTELDHKSARRQAPTPMCSGRSRIN